MTDRNLLRAQLLIEAADILDDVDKREKMNEGAIATAFGVMGFLTVGLPLILCISIGIVSAISSKIDTKSTINKMKKNKISFVDLYKKHNNKFKKYLDYLKLEAPSNYENEVNSAIKKISAENVKFKNSLSKIILKNISELDLFTKDLPATDGFHYIDKDEFNNKWKGKLTTFIQKQYDEIMNIVIKTFSNIKLIIDTCIKNLNDDYVPIDSNKLYSLTDNIFTEYKKVKDTFSNQYMRYYSATCECCDGDNFEFIPYPEEAFGDWLDHDYYLCKVKEIPFIEDSFNGIMKILSKVKNKGKKE